MIRYALGAVALASMACAAQAQSVTAANPAGIAAAMKNAGYTADVDTDEMGDPLITTQLGGWDVRIVFYGCDENTHGGCDSVQFRTGFDRESPMDPKRALAIADQFRFVAVSLDDEGDPYLTWDVVTDEGIPQSVFLHDIEHYGSVIDSAAQIIFEDE